MLQWRKLNVTAKLSTHAIQTYHKKPCLNVVTFMLLEETLNNVVLNQYKEAG